MFKAMMAKMKAMFTLSRADIKEYDLPPLTINRRAFIHGSSKRHCRPDWLRKRIAAKERQFESRRRNWR